jgi:hypothetical protein
MKYPLLAAALLVLALSACSAKDVAVATPSVPAPAAALPSVAPLADSATPLGTDGTKPAGTTTSAALDTPLKVK